MSDQLCWKGYAGHWCASPRARFHLATVLPTGFLVSTVGDAVDDQGNHITVGVGPELYETMVFRCAHPSPPGTDPEVEDWLGVAARRYMTSADAEIGHHDMIRKYMEHNNE